MSKTNKQKLGSKLKSLRVAKGKLLRQVAADLDIDSAVLSKIENNVILPNDKLVKKLSDYYKIDLDNLRIDVYSEKIVRQYGTFRHAGKMVDAIKDKLHTYEAGTDK
ncbi:MAG: helix-turn-helix transcriptional regulator [Candidatus Edwardsbacteria bacterium]|nr:helix-turn-helix transcriptional regulator [Candidatus Edwardsbacteria bacterium]